MSSIFTTPPANIQSTLPVSTTTPTSIVYITNPASTTTPKPVVYITNPASTTTPSASTTTPKPVVYITNPASTTTPTPVVYITNPASTTTPTPNLNTIDTTSLMGVLNNYLIKSPLLNNPDGDYSNVISQIDNINSGLGGMNKSMNTDIAGNILSQQGNVNTIVDTEMNRLNQKQQSIDSALTTQKRMLLMNDSYLKRQKVYLRIMVAIVIGLVILLLCKFLSAYLGDDENANVLITMVCILVIVAVIVYCGWSYVLMLRRDPIYFDQLHYLPDNKPITLTGNNDVQLISAPNTNITNTCIGAACCSNKSGTVWDTTSNACIKEGFTSVKRTRPYEQNEMENYSMYKL